MRVLTVALALALVAGALSGCGKKPSSLTDPQSSGATGGTAVEQAAVSSVLAQTPTLIEDGAYDDPSATTFDAGATASAFAVVQPITFWRNITSVRRAVTFSFADTDSTGHPTVANVVVHKFLRGRFNVLAGFGNPDSLPFDSTKVLHKRLADDWERHLMLTRRTGHELWRVSATSGVEVTSFDPASTDDSPAFGHTRILSLRVQAPGVDTTITDPLGLFHLRRVIAVNATDMVTLTATTNANDDVVVLMWRGRKLRFHNNGDGTYTGTWMAPLLAGLGHVGVNALSHGTLFDTAAPYDSQAWILPYVVRPTQLAEFMP